MVQHDDGAAAVCTFEQPRKGLTMLVGPVVSAQQLYTTWQGHDAILQQGDRGLLQILLHLVDITDILVVAGHHIDALWRMDLGEDFVKGFAYQGLDTIVYQIAGDQDDIGLLCIDQVDVFLERRHTCAVT